MKAGNMKEKIGDKEKERLKGMINLASKTLNLQQNLLIDLVNELLKFAEAKIVITVDELLTITKTEGKKEWIADLTLRGGGGVKIKTKTLEPLMKERLTEIRVTGIYINILKNEIGFVI